MLKYSTIPGKYKSIESDCKYLRYQYYQQGKTSSHLYERCESDAIAAIVDLIYYGEANVEQQIWTKYFNCTGIRFEVRG